MAGGQGGALGHGAGTGGQGDQVQTAELVADVAPGVVGGVLHDPDEQQCEPAELDVGADAVLAVWWNTERRPRWPFMSRHPDSTAMSCLYAAARSSGDRVGSEVRSSHLPSRCASDLIALWSMRSRPALVRRR